MRYCPKSSSSTSTTELDLQELKGDLHSFIEQSSKGNRGTRELISRESMGIRTHVSSISTETNEVLGRVHQRLDSLVLTSDIEVNQAKRERLLQSLKYPGFNERRNHVSDAYENTGRWIFAGDGEEDSRSQDDTTSNSDDMDSETSDSIKNSQNSSDDLSDLQWDSFSNWLRSTGKFYWISGKPGSGKSTLVKFVLNHPDTKTYLGVWQPGALIISHFFWRPGTSLQQNIKGLLCSLLHQLLYNSAITINSVLLSIPDSNMKDSDTDWSTAELLDLCLKALSAYDHPVCIFLDGLDEVDPRDGVDSLLELIFKISQSKNMKICLSSRPEPLLQRRLSTYPRLRLQDLNMNDLKLYAQDHVKFPPDFISEHYGDPINLLVDKAEGVFLWLVLATRSINKGVEYGDTTAEFQERIDQLPGDLTHLYKDMWKRACEDDPLAYRKLAAFYFKLLLTHRRYEKLFPLFFHSFSLLSFMLASTSTADEIIQAGGETHKLISEDVMLQRCRETEKKVDVYCFGLVEFDEQSNHFAWPRVVGIYGHEYDELVQFTGDRRVLRFIHRTAHDFLVDTAEGKEILDFNASSALSLETQMIKAYLTENEIFLHCDILGDSNASSAAMPLSVLRHLRVTYESKDDWVATNWRQLFNYCEILCNAGKCFSGPGHQARLCKGEDFLKVAANTCADERILSAIEERNLSKDTKSEILLNACSTLQDASHDFDVRNRFVEETIRMLLKDSADPNHKGVMFSPAFWRWPFAQLKTPFTEYLQRTFMLSKARYLRSEELLAALETLRLYVHHEANLDEMVVFFFELKNCVPIGRKDSAWTLNLFRENYGVDCLSILEGIDSFLIALLPAHSVLDALLYTMRQSYSPPVEETKSEDMLECLENECLNWHSSERPRVIGQACRGWGNSRESAWFETSIEHQERIGSELLSQVRSDQPSSPASVRRMELQGDGERVELLLSLCAQAPWGLKASGENAIWARFEELRIFTRVDGFCELHSTEDWIKRR